VFDPPGQCKGVYAQKEWDVSFNGTLLTTEETASLGLDGRVHAGFAKQAVSQA
jgi:hypothetical protein